MTTTRKPSPASNVLRADAAVAQLIEPIVAILDKYKGATEFSVVRPHEAFVMQNGAWHRLDLPEFSLARFVSLAQAVAIYANQDVSERNPLLSATLPGGQRVQFVLAPAVEPGTIAMSIRIPATHVRALSAYVKDGAFDRFAWRESVAVSAMPADSLSLLERNLIDALQRRDLMSFLVQAVIGKKNIAVVGDTGSGKTTLMKSMCQYIPSHERLITIEDVRELFLPKHANVSHLLYSKGSQGVAKVSPADLIGACMRLLPDRVLLAELRGSEAFDFLKLLTTGHSGSITSFHAESCALAAQRYVFMAKEHADAAIFTDEALKRLVSLTIDIVLHVTAMPVAGEAGEITGVERFVTEVSFNPALKKVEAA